MQASTFSSTFVDPSLSRKHSRVQDIPTNDVAKKAKIVPPVDRFARRKSRAMTNNTTIAETLKASRQDLHYVTTCFTSCMIIQKQVSENQLRRDKEIEDQKYTIKVDDPLFNLFLHEWDLLNDEEQANFFNNVIKIMLKYQTD